MTFCGDIGPRDPNSLTVFLDLCCFFFAPNLCMTPCHPFPLVIAATSTLAPVSKIWSTLISFPNSSLTWSNCFLISPPLTNASKMYGFFCSNPAALGDTATIAKISLIFS